MKTIEQAAALHLEINRNAPHPGGLYQCITTNAGMASNQEAQSLTFTSRVAPADVQGDDRNSLYQGFGCVEVAITAKWGGCNHDGTPRTETEITVHMLDRLAGGMAQRTWHTNGAWSSVVISDEEVLPLLRTLLGQESMAEIEARKAATEEKQAQELKDWFGQFGI